MSAKPPAPPPGPKGASPPPGAAGDFAALLDQTSARTASAEGPKNRPAQPESRNRDAAAPEDNNKGALTPDAQAAPVADPAQPQAAVEAQPVTDSTGGLTSQGGESSQDPAPSDAESTPAAAQSVADPIWGLTPQRGELAQGPAPASAAVAAMTPATTATAPAADAQAAAAVTAIATPQSGAAGGATSADASALPADGKLQIPAELLNAKGDATGGQAKDFKNGDQPQRELPPAPTLPPTAEAAAAPTAPTAAAPTAAAPTPPADAVTPSAPAPTVATHPAATPQTATAVGTGAPQLSRASVAQTVERVQELVRIVATRAGTARAVLQLRPAELGQVDVHLRTTRNGLVATIAAHEQVGLDALQQAGNELRRTLEDKGVQLHSLDLQLGTGQNGFTNQGDAREASSGRRDAAATHVLDDDTVAEHELTITHAPSTPAGALVDVQA
jgi:flagellar hook-length control protein FliK